MKHLVCLLFAVVFLFGICACSQAAPENPVNYYYPLLKDTCAAGDRVFAAEVRERTIMSDVSVLIAKYLLGPIDTTLMSPFPAGTRLVNLHTEGTVLTITLSDRFATLSGLELTLACSALSMTCMELTGATTVQIRAQKLPLNGAEQITIHAEDLLLTDTSNMATTEPIP